MHDRGKMHWMVPKFIKKTNYLESKDGTCYKIGADEFSTTVSSTKKEAGLPSQPEIIKPHKSAHISCHSAVEAFQKAKSPTCVSASTDPEASQQLRMLISDRWLSTRMMEKLNISGDKSRCIYLFN